MYNSEHFLGYVIFFHLPSVNLQVFGSQNCTLTLGEINTSWTPPETDRPRRKKLWRFKDLVTSNCKQYYNRCFIQKCPENFLCLFFFFVVSNKTFPGHLLQNQKLLLCFCYSVLDWTLCSGTKWTNLIKSPRGINSTEAVGMPVRDRLA